MAPLWRKVRSHYSTRSRLARVRVLALCLLLLPGVAVTLLMGAAMAPSHAQTGSTAPAAGYSSVNYAVEHEGVTVGRIDGYNYLGGTAISVQGLFDLLRFNYTYDSTEKRIYGKDLLGQWFIINSKTNTIITGTTEHNYSSGQVSVAGDILFADITLLARHFPINLSVNYVNNTLALTFKDEAKQFKDIFSTLPSSAMMFTNQEQGLADAGIEGPAPDETMPAPVVIRENDVIPPQEETTAASTVAEEPPLGETPVAVPLAAKQDAVIDTRLPLEPFEVDEANYLIFELLVDNLTYDSILDIYQQEDYFFVPLKQLVNAVEFAIKVDPEKGTASGWFIEDKNVFSLDVNAGKATVAGIEYTLTPQQAFIDQDDIYVSLELYNQWFPLNAIVNYNRQALQLKPSILLPFQARKKRETEREVWFARKEKQPEYPRHIPEYGFGQMPMADVNINLNHQRPEGSAATTTADYSTIFTGDVGVGNMNAFVSGNDREITTARVIASRKDIDGNILGHLTELEVGDVDSATTELVAFNEIGRGVVFSNFPLNRASQFDTTVINGDILPGWEVEIYSNNALLDFQIAGADGRYEFRDVPIYYGNNIIRIVFYGPQGEVREEVREFVVNDSIVNEGVLNYRVSATERNKTLFSSTLDEDTLPGRTRTTADFEYGLTDRLTLYASTTFTELDTTGEGKAFQTLGAATAIGEVLTKFNTAYDVSTGGWAAEVIANTRFEEPGISLRFEHEQYSEEYVSEINENDSDRRESITSVDMSGSIDAPVISGVSYSLGADVERFFSGREITTLSNRLSTSYSGLAFTNELNSTFNDTGEETSESLQGNFTTRGRLFDVDSIRADATYQLLPIKELQTISLIGQRDLNKQLTARVDLQKSFVGERAVTLAGLLTWDSGDFRLSNNLSIDTENNITISTNLGFSLYQEPRSGEWEMTSQSVAYNGATSSVAFLDENYNNVLDEGEEILTDVTFRKNNIEVKPNEAGVAVITNLSESGPVNVSLDAGSLPDALLHPSQPGYAVLGRAGVFSKLDFPVQETSEIDGVVYFSGEESEQTVSGITLYLLTADGKKINQTKTEFDGLYIFTKVLPGEYFIVIAEDELRKLGVTPEEQVAITIDKGSDIYSGFDIILQKGGSAVAALKDSDEGDDDATEAPPADAIAEVMQSVLPPKLTYPETPMPEQAAAAPLPTAPALPEQFYASLPYSRYAGAAPSTSFSMDNLAAAMPHYSGGLSGTGTGSATDKAFHFYNSYPTFRETPLPALPTPPVSVASLPDAPLYGAGNRAALEGPESRYAAYLSHQGGQSSGGGAPAGAIGHSSADGTTTVYMAPTAGLTLPDAQLEAISAYIARLNDQRTRLQEPVRREALLTAPGRAAAEPAIIPASLTSYSATPAPSTPDIQDYLRVYEAVAARQSTSGLRLGEAVDYPAEKSAFTRPALYPVKLVSNAGSAQAQNTPAPPRIFAPVPEDTAPLYQTSPALEEDRLEAFDAYLQNRTNTPANSYR